MRISALSVGLLALLTPLAAAWSKEDHEIFRIRDELVAHEGANVTFYDFIGVSPSASQDEINKAYRKRTRSLHPDKVKQQLQAERIKKNKEAQKEALAQGKKKPGVSVTKPPTQAEIRAAVKKASDLQTRLGVVAGVLRGEGRARYDHFLANGFPTWKGTNYYYSRYRPGLGTVLFGLFVFGGGAAHYIALYMGWKRQREFVERYIKFARHAAWGDNVGGLGIPGIDTQPAVVAPPPSQLQDEDGRPIVLNRRQRRMQDKDSKREAAKEGRKKPRPRRGGGASGTSTPVPATESGPSGTRKRVVAENGKVLVVDSLGDVYLEQEDDEGNVDEFLLDPNELACPTIRDTAVYRLPAWIFAMTIGRALPQKPDEEEEEVEEEIIEDNDDDDSEPGKATPSSESNEDYEMLEKSTDSLRQAKASGSQAAAKAKANKRKSKKK